MVTKPMPRKLDSLVCPYCGGAGLKWDAEGEEWFCRICARRPFGYGVRGFANPERDSIVASALGYATISSRANSGLISRMPNRREATIPEPKLPVPSKPVVKKKAEGYRVYIEPHEWRHFSTWGFAKRPRDKGCLWSPCAHVYHDIGNCHNKKWGKRHQASCLRGCQGPHVYGCKFILTINTIYCARHSKQYKAEFGVAPPLWRNMRIWRWSAEVTVKWNLSVYAGRPARHRIEVQTVSVIMPIGGLRQMPRAIQKEGPWRNVINAFKADMNHPVTGMVSAITVAIKG